MLAAVYFGFIYGLYALSFFLPTIIDGFQEQFGTTFDLFQKGMITAIPYVPAAVVLYFWSRDAFRRGVRVWHIAVPALVGGLSIPVALYMNSPAATIAVIAVTACAIFAALPNFWTVPTQFLTGAAAAAGSRSSTRSATSVGSPLRTSRASSAGGPAATRSRCSSSASSWCCRAC